MADMLVELIEKFIGGSEATLNSLFKSMTTLVFFIENKNEQEPKEANKKILSLIRPISIGQPSSIWNGYTKIIVKNLKIM